MSTRILIGGPSYRYQCDVRNRDHTMMLAVALARAGMQIGPCSEVGCPVEYARHGQMASAIGSKADFLLSLDGDTWLTDASQVVDAIAWMKVQAQPYVAFPTMRRDGVSNVQLLSLPGIWARKHAVPEGPVPVQSVGAAAVLMYLPMYREMWRTGPWWRTEWPDGAIASEDIWHCGQLAERMGTYPVVWGDHWASHGDGNVVL